ncbi:hypothetical protein D3C85_1556580 [compost metagenome]
MRVLGAGAQVGTEAGLLDDQPGGEAYGQGRDYDPGTIGRQVHEAEVQRAAQRLRGWVGVTRAAVQVGEGALDDQRQAEGQ